MWQRVQAGCDRVDGLPAYHCATAVCVAIVRHTARVCVANAVHPVSEKRDIRSARAEDLVACVSEAGQDVAVFVQSFIECGGVDVDIRVGRLHC